MSLFDNNFLFPPPPSIYMSTMSVITLIALANLGFSELRGKHLHYSKFWNVGTCRTGMLILYTPAFLAGTASLWLCFDTHDLRFLLVSSALAFHFFKRDIEVLFVHKYSGGMVLNSTILISNLPLLLSVPDPETDLKFIGIALFLVGIVGSFYHHCILANLRKEKSGADKGYKIPKGGLFGVVVCPHYFFEILTFIGISLMAQSLYPICFAIGDTCYLIGRSCVTRKWYLSKFPNFPKHVKALAPFVF
ncbi:hypothetical protein MKX03_025214 [Papaver bracteatum]|nr:hypothetical protein MKX03_025214 [Papaver bracteatum]